MKILSVVWYKVLPANFGGQKGIAVFNEQLSRHVELVCLCSSNNEKSSGLPYRLRPELPISRSQFLWPSCWKKIKRVATEEQPTHIILEHPYHAFAAVKAAKKVGAKIILHSHNIESDRLRRQNDRMAGWLHPYEKWIHRRADLVLFKTVADRAFALRRFSIPGDKCLVIPYGIPPVAAPDHEGAPEEIRKRFQIAADEKILLFAGTLDYGPNAKAVEHIFREIAPRLGAEGFKCKIIICGRNRKRRFKYLQDLSDPHIILAGEVDDISLFFSAADLFINPVLSGGGIQTKNIDALAHHCPVICFESQLDDDLARIAYPNILAAPTNDFATFTQMITRAAHPKRATPGPFFELYNWENILRPLVSWINNG